LLLAVTLLIRWMGGGPERFWLGPFALGIPCTVSFARRWSRARPLIAAVYAALLAWQVGAALIFQYGQTKAAITAPRVGNWLDEPSGAIVPKLPPGSRILLIAGQSSRDYPLFLPRQGYTNQL